MRKDAEPGTLLAAVRAVARGNTCIDPSVSRDLRQQPGAEALTGRESEVLRQMVRGSSNREIAAALGVGEETVKTHVGQVLSKLQADNRAQAIVCALKRGLVSLDDAE